jgi:hypothetical protein
MTGNEKCEIILTSISQIYLIAPDFLVRGVTSGGLHSPPRKNMGDRNETVQGTHGGDFFLLFHVHHHALGAGISKGCLFSSNN